ncbi:hypothetical protein FQU76_04790 [Streptomyces qinzhouensis]|uniref:Uncharacterized protein n=1 Tax=Streptomyces qinzhouensis TaxID=2599401 RepID=A0A5B8JLJ9_9ACTN|nr:hypothetical protein FQU76_04790 [Streptomyces qinzhouensis]
MTARLRPVPARRPARTVAAAVCAVLGLGLIGGAVTATALTGGAGAGSAEESAYDRAHALWHTASVNSLFPPTIRGPQAGPGKADRVWTRIAVAPDSDCATALDPGLAATLVKTGCARVVRATYTDATSTNVTTVGMVFTGADEHDMASLAQRVDAQSLDERPDLLPRAFPAKGTVAERFGAAQRASWSLKVLPDVPVVVYAVSGFADGRAAEGPQPVTAARDAKSTAPAAQAGLGHEAAGLAAGAERALRSALNPPTEAPE